MKNFNIFLLVCILAVSLCGCGAKKTVETIDDAVPYYKERSSAQAEDGSFYYVAKYPFLNKSVKLLYYYDNKSNAAYPLCSNASCSHTGTDCDAYFSEKECLGETIWYYKERIYMIERDSENDNLVSYDKTGYDKKIETTLSADGLSVISSSAYSAFCMDKDTLYYMLAEENMVKLYACRLDNVSEHKLITTYQGNMMLGLCARNGRVYVNKMINLDAGSIGYGIDYINTSDYTVTECVMYSDNPEGIQGDISDWVKEVCFDNDNNFYFPSVYEDDYIINKINLGTKEISEFYRFEGEGHTEEIAADTNFVNLLGFDGKYLIVKKGVNVKYQDEISDFNNYIYVINTDKELINKITLKKSDEDFSMGSSNIGVKYLGVINGKLIITTDRFDIKGLEVPESWQEKYNDALKQKKTPSICVVLMHDITAEDIEGTAWQNITYNIDE